MSYSETKVLGAQLHKKCVAQGVPVGSAEFDVCMKQELGREASIRQENRNRQQSGTVCNNVFGTVICS